MSKSYTSKTADTVMVLFIGIMIFVLGGTIGSLWKGDLWLAFCRGIGFLVMLGVTTLCHEAWKTK